MIGTSIPECFFIACLHHELVTAPEDHLVSVSHHWNNFLWPLIITNSVETRPVTVGLSIFAAVDQGVDWSLINAATLMTSGPLLIAFLLFQRQFVQSFMRAGIR